MLLLYDEIFIKWKLIVFYWLFGFGLVIVSIVFKRNLIRIMMEK
jgi:Intracellular septation protein A